MIRKTICALRATACLLAAAALVGNGALAQEPEPLTLEELVAPVALYPDDVLGIILPASTFPLDIVQAARFLEDLEENPDLEPDASWDDSIVALLNYPEVIAMMNEDLDWTWALGEAVLADQGAVLAAAQSFRSQAYAVGNLASDERQIVTRNAETIVIEPADPEVIYIPYYEPREVIVYQPRPVIHYYPVGYPVYYYPYPAGYRFAVDYFWGVTSWYSLGWHSHYVHVHHHTHRLHPYYLNSYYFYTDYYPRRSVNVTVTVNNYDDVWRPSTVRAGNRPRTVTTESRTSAVRTDRTRTTETQPGVTSRTARTSSTPTRSAATSSQRVTSTRSIESPPVTSSTRSVRTLQPTTSTRPTTRSQQIVTPSTRSTTRSSSPTTRSSTSSQSQGSTRRSTTSNFSSPSVSSPPVSSPPVSSGSTTRSSSSSGSNAAPRQAPADRGSATRTRMR